MSQDSLGIDKSSVPQLTKLSFIFRRLVGISNLPVKKNQWFRWTTMSQTFLKDGDGAGNFPPCSFAQFWDWTISFLRKRWGFAQSSWRAEGSPQVVGKGIAGNHLGGQDLEPFVFNLFLETYGINTSAWYKEANTSFNIDFATIWWLIGKKTKNPGRQADH